MTPELWYYIFSLLFTLGAGSNLELGWKQFSIILILAPVFMPVFIGRKLSQI